nr:MAK10-like protein [Tanacetum cinerariifolium]
MGNLGRCWAKTMVEAGEGGGCEFGPSFMGHMRGFILVMGDVGSGKVVVGSSYVTVGKGVIIFRIIRVISPGDVNPIRTLGHYSKPSHEGYRNTVELSVGNNVVPLRSDTIRLVQNGCSFYGLWSEDPNQHLKDFLRLVDSLDLDGESLSEAWTRFKELLQKVPHHGIDIYVQVQIFYDLTTRGTIDQSTGGKLRTRNTKESWALLEDIAFYENESWNDPSDFAKTVKEISLPQDQDDMISKINLFWKAVSKKLDDTPVRDTAGNTAAQMNFTSTNNLTRKELRGKGIKSPSNEEEFEEETKDEIKEDVEDSPKHFDTFPTMKELRLGPRRKPSNRGKICNFMGRVKGLKVSVRNFTYECDFMRGDDVAGIKRSRRDLSSNGVRNLATFLRMNSL